MLQGVSFRLLACAVVFPVFLAAQATFGTITGSVTDSTGAVVPGAAIEVTNEGTNATRTITSGASGTYEVPNLNAGIYRVVSKHPGFKTFIVKGVDIAALRTVRVDIRMEVGEVGTEVTVQGLAP